MSRLESSRDTASKPLYLDYHATTPVDARVLEAMLPYFSERFGNPHSRQHAWGWEARDAVATAHKSVLDLCHRLQAEGCAVTIVGVDAGGTVDLDALKRALRPETILVS